MNNPELDLDTVAFQLVDGLVTSHDDETVHAILTKARDRIREMMTEERDRLNAILQGPKPIAVARRHGRSPGFGETEGRVRETLQENPQGLALGDVTKLAGSPYHYTSVLLRKMDRQGTVRKTNGLWFLVDT